jgi:hypothetical protein
VGGFCRTVGGFGRAFLLAGVASKEGLDERVGIGTSSTAWFPIGYLAGFLDSQFIRIAVLVGQAIFIRVFFFTFGVVSAVPRSPIRSNSGGFSGRSIPATGSRPQRLRCNSWRSFFPVQANCGWPNGQSSIWLLGGQPGNGRVSVAYILHFANCLPRFNRAKRLILYLRHHFFCEPPHGLGPAFQGRDIKRGAWACEWLFGPGEREEFFIGCN